MNQKIDDDSLSLDELSLTLDERSELEESTCVTNVPIRFKNQDIDVHGLVERIKAGHILIPKIGNANDSLEMNPFQRGFVWNNKQMDSFIESLLLEYPTPSIFLVRQSSDRRLVVLDGQQRLETLTRYYSGVRGDKVYRLKLGSESRFNGLSYSELSDPDRRTLDDTYITTTVISASTGDETKAYEAIYDVFARLNSGGTQLSAHEIRMALYNGPLMAEIDRLNRLPSWRSIYGTEEVNKRFRDHELILRILALYLEEDAYRKPLARFLNSFSSRYRKADGEHFVKACQSFTKAAELLSACNLPRVFSIPGRQQLNNAKADSIMIALMKRLDREPIEVESLRHSIEALDANESYLSSIRSSTSDEMQVHKRIHIASEVFNEYD